MDLSEVMAQYGGHTERLPQEQIRFGREINLPELIKELDAWKEVWDRLDPQTSDQLPHDKRRQLEKELKQHAQVLTDMTFRVETIDNYPQSLVRKHICDENPDQKHLIKELFSPTSWWAFIAYAKATDLGYYLDFCHVNTRKIARLKVSANSPAVNHFGMADPIAPRGKITIY